MQSHVKIQRRRFMSAVAALAAVSLAQAQPSTYRPMVEVWKAPTCGCCKDWIKRLESNGLQVKTYETGNVAARKELGMPDKFASCHTARVEGYALEGHVPVREVKRLLRERPKGIGLAVPGMPIGSAGMDGSAYAGRRDPYDVLLVQRDGTSTVYQAYR